MRRRIINPYPEALTLIMNYKIMATASNGFSPTLAGLFSAHFDNNGEAMTSRTHALAIERAPPLIHQNNIPGELQ